MKALSLFMVVVLGFGFRHPPLPSRARGGTCPPATASVVGAWHLLAAEDVDPLGRVTHPLGDHPIGLLIYAESGEMSIQMAKTPLLPNFPAALADSSWSVISPEDMIATLDGYYAYFGTYTVDTVRRIVIHHITADIAREYSGTNLDRPYRINGDTLVLGDGVTWRRIFLRACAVPSAAPDAVPVFREPRHLPVFQNRLVRVLDVRIPSGDTTLYHLHANSHIGVVISSARTWHQTRGQQASSVDTVAEPVGSILDNTNERLPYTHRVGNADTVALRYVVGQLLAWSGVDAPALPASSGLQLERETADARVYRVTLAPGQSTKVHRHVQPGLTVMVGPGALRLEGTAPEATSRQAGAGAWWWRGAGNQHVLRNVGAQPLEIVEIDWR